MTPAASKIRRWLAGACLTLSVIMLALGLTVLDKRLKPYQFLTYWGVCICLTALAAISALIDLLLLSRRLREEQRFLIEQTLRDAANETDKHSNN